MLKKTTLTSLVLTSALFGPVARAQTPGEILEDAVPPAPPEEGEEKPAEGWKLTGNLGLTFSFNNASNVVGVDSGTTLAIGGVLGFAANLRSGPHQWENNLLLQHTQTKTPSINGFLKSADNLELKSTYFYRFENPKWFGPFGKANLRTSILSGFTKRPAQVTTTRPDPAGGAPITRVVPAQTRIDLTGAFEPLLIKEAVGAFAHPIETDEFTLRGRLGIGGQHIINSGGVLVKDDAGTPELELVPLGEANELGSVLELDLKGQVVKDVLSWGLETETFLALVTSLEGDLEFVDRINIDVNGKLSLKLNDWLSFDYALLVRRVPVVTLDVQVQNTVIANITYEVL